MTNKENIYFAMGVARSATTWVYKMLKAHPSVHAPYKDIHYFNDLSVFKAVYLPSYEQGEKWYLEQFNPTKNQICVDASPLYFMDKIACQRIYEFNKNCKIIISLRNPYEAVLSHYYQFQKSYNIKKSFLEVITENENNFLESNLIYAPLSNYLSTFPRKNILICLYDDMIQNTEIYLKNIYQFIGVDENILPVNFHNRVNQRMRVKSITTRNLHSYVTKFANENKLLRYVKNYIYKFVTPDTIVSLLSFNLDKNNTLLYRNLTDTEVNILYDFYARDIEKFISIPEFQHLNWRLSK
jgi:hypothetical protein